MTRGPFLGGLHALSHRGAALPPLTTASILRSAFDVVPGAALRGHPAVLRTLLCLRKLPRRPRGAARVAAHTLSLLFGLALGSRAGSGASGHRASGATGRAASARCPEAAGALCGFIERRRLVAGCLPRCG